MRMVKNWVGFGLLGVGLGLIAVGPVWGQDFEGTGRIDYFGYEDCVFLQNGDTRVVLGHQAGGRVLEYAYRGVNAIYLDEAGRGWMAGDAGSMGSSGGRFDIGPERTVPKRPALWMGSWAVEIIGPRAARMTSVDDAATGTRLIREFRLDEKTSELRCTQTIINIAQTTRPLNHWSRTMAVGGGIVAIPLSEHSRYPEHYVRYDGPGLVNHNPKDAKIRRRDGFLEVVGTPQAPKLGMDSTVGWFGYVMKNDLLFLKRYKTYPRKVYGDVAAMTISIWYFEDLKCELEPMGPTEWLAPGEAASFTERWWLLEFDYPKKGGELDLEKLKRVVGEAGR